MVYIRPQLNDSDLRPGESLFSLACAKRGLDPAHTSYVTLASRYLGSSEDLSLKEIEKRLGTDWQNVVVRLFNKLIYTVTVM